MNNLSREKIYRFSFLLLAALCLLPTQFSGSKAQNQPLSKNEKSSSWKKKIAPDLEEPGDLQKNDLRRIVVNFNAATSDAVLNSRVLGLGGKIHRIHRNMSVATIDVPRSRVNELAASGEIEYISPDRPLMAFGHIETTTGAQQIRSLLSGTTLDGRGIGIAILDSGIDSNHKLIRASADHPGVVKYSSFVSNAATTDKYGHGTHVASILSGSIELGKGLYEGIAPGANLINLRVLDEHGIGTISSLIAAIDWCITNKTLYNIRIINLSVGAVATDSYRTDPLCLAARRAVNAGIIVVSAAGNDGKSDLVKKVYGGIHSPATDPSVITVGATNSLFTDQRSDDKIATYSSRGPTRGYTIDATGMRMYDNLIKPDLVAPGNKIIGASSSNPDTKNSINNLVASFPVLAIDTTTKPADRIMYLNGTSVATPIVSGAVALMLQANPNLTPNLVKAILMYTAQPIRGYNTLEQGAGSINIDGAIRIARLVKSNASALSNSTAMLSGSLPSPQLSTIAGETCWWGQGVITNHCFLTGSNLMIYWQGIYSRGITLGDATRVSNGSFSQVPGLTSWGISNSLGVTFADGYTMADGYLLASGVTFADGTTFSSGVTFADGQIVYDSTSTTKSVKSKVVVPGD